MTITELLQSIYNTRGDIAAINQPHWTNPNYIPQHLLDVIFPPPKPPDPPPADLWLFRPTKYQLWKSYHSVRVREFYEYQHRLTRVHKMVDAFESIPMPASSKVRVRSLSRKLEIIPLPNKWRLKYEPLESRPFDPDLEDYQISPDIWNDQASM